MIDHHTEYTHGLASDMRRRHLPPSASSAGWDFSTDCPTTTGYLRNILPVLAFAVAVIGLIAIGSRIGL